MERNVDLNELTDGKRYGSNDLVRVGCDDCKGCSSCCQGMGTSILVDPFDTYRLTSNLEKSFEQLLQSNLELNVVDGLILPNLKMGGKKEQCTFLNEEGRCSIHPHRPGICRIFPLGRLYEENGFSYILQVHECKKPNKTKVKVQKWIDTKDFNQNEAFIIKWHDLTKRAQKILKASCDDQMNQKINVFILNLFYLQPYEKERSFYEQFEQRRNQAEKIFDSIAEN